MDEEHKIIDSLFQKYIGKPALVAKLSEFIKVQLPLLLEDVENTNNEKKKMKLQQMEDKKKFIFNFLNQPQSQFFYIPNTELFIKYDERHYSVYNEDDIQYEILSKISLNKNIMPQKHKIKSRIMTEIKKNHLFKSIPDSITIQFILNNLYPAIFKTKNHAKYFLSILGDNIIKKNEHLIHFINSNAKHFLKSIAHYCDNYFEIGKPVTDTFRYKYHEHKYANCRIMDINDNLEILNIWNHIDINHKYLDLLCVALHYSNRYESSENFLLQHCNTTSFMERVLFIKSNTQEMIVKSFIDTFIQDTNHDESCVIPWKNMLFLWKKYLIANELPTIIYSNTFKQLIMNQLTYKEDTDCFINVTSKYLPLLAHFSTFWNSTIDNDSSEYEIGELIDLFKNWCKQNKINISPISENSILEIIQYFYPDIKIENNKYILHICCKLWNKQTDMHKVIKILKKQYKNNHESLPLTLQIAYRTYCKLAKDNNYKYIVSKHYFEKYLLENIPAEYIDNDGFISNEWWLS